MNKLRIIYIVILVVSPFFLFCFIFCFSLKKNKNLAHFKAPLSVSEGGKHPSVKKIWNSTKSLIIITSALCIFCLLNTNSRVVETEYTNGFKKILSISSINNMKNWCKKIPNLNSINNSKAKILNSLQKEFVIIERKEYETLKNLVETKKQEQLKKIVKKQEQVKNLIDRIRDSKFAYKGWIIEFRSVFLRPLYSIKILNLKSLKGTILRYNTLNLYFIPSLFWDPELANVYGWYRPWENLAVNRAVERRDNNYPLSPQWDILGYGRLNIGYQASGLVFDGNRNKQDWKRRFTASHNNLPSDVKELDQLIQKYSTIEHFLTSRKGSIVGGLIMTGNGTKNYATIELELDQNKRVYFLYSVLTIADLLKSSA